MVRRRLLVTTALLVLVAAVYLLGPLAAAKSNLSSTSSHALRPPPLTAAITQRMDATPRALQHLVANHRDRCGLLDRVIEYSSAPHGCNSSYDAVHSVPNYRGTIWTVPVESCMLYLLGKLSTGAIAEQGPFLGASTIAIAAGLRASQRPERLFTTSDAFPAPASATADGTRYEYPHYWRLLRERDAGLWPLRAAKDGAVAMHIDGQVRGTLPLSVYDHDVRPYNEGAMGQMGTLVSNLRAANVDRLVSVVTGSSLPRGIPYEVVWSDSTHNLKEISATVPTHLTTANLSRAQCLTFAWHDINPTSEPAIVPIDGAGAVGAIAGEKRVAIERLIEAAGCTARRRAAAGLIYSVMVVCGGSAPQPSYGIVTSASR